MQPSINKIILFFVIFLCVAGFSVASFFLDKKPSTAEISKEKIEPIIREYLTQNPEVLIDSLQAYQVKQQQQQQQQAQAAVSDHKEALERDPATPVAGNVNGDVTMVEFFDYACGYCHRAFESVAKVMEEDKNLRVVLKELPILSEQSTYAAKVSLAVNIVAPDKYFAFHSALMQANIRDGESVIWKAVEDLGLNVDEVKAAMQQPEIAKSLEENRNLAEKLNIRGTPAFVIGGELVPGYVEMTALQEKIKAAREKK
jgi:protein-disulfide isomerase